MNLFQTSKNRPEFLTLTRRCSGSKEHYSSIYKWDGKLYRFERIDRPQKRSALGRMKDMLRAESLTINTEEMDFAGDNCPYCGSEAFVLCSCSTLSCMDLKNSVHTCPSCRSTGPLGAPLERISGGIGGGQLLLSGQLRIVSK
jgi:hypothetical protein